MRRRIAVVAVTAALALGATIGTAVACEPPPTKEKCNNGVGNGPDCRPGKAHFNNDDAGGIPSAPGAFFKVLYQD